MKKLFTLILLAVLSNAFAQTTQQFTSSGTWLCPAGVTLVTVECLGGGGGGGGADAAGSTSFKGGGGGGGGAYVKKASIIVVPGTTYTITVGAGGASESPGGKSEFSGGAVTAVTASGGTPGTRGSSTRNAGVGGVLGGVYAYTLTAGGSAYSNASPNVTTTSVTGGGGSGASVGLSVNSTNAPVSSVVPAAMGTGYTSAPTVTFTSPVGSGAMATGIFNPNINSPSATGGTATVTPGANGSPGLSPGSTRGTGTATWASGSTTITLTTATNTNLAATNYITGPGIPVGTTIISYTAGSAGPPIVGATVVLSQATTAAAATSTAFTVFRATGAVGGAGGAGGTGGAGGAATSNAYNQTFAAGNPAVGLGGGGGGAISETGTQPGGTGGAGQVILTFTTTSVELTNLDAKRQDKSTLITWKTASEKDNAMFNVEQSTDGKTFKTIGEVKGNGTTASANNYSFEHLTPAVGVNYYRLKQMDYNGTETYSAVRSVVFGNNGLVVKNTLVKDVVTVIVNEEATSTVNIFNISGQQVMTAKAKGEQTLDVSTLPSGIYMIRTTTGDVSRFVKQ
jgi:Secretion system C-terminal sorting domain